MNKSVRCVQPRASLFTANCHSARRLRFMAMCLMILVPHDEHPCFAPISVGARVVVIYWLPSPPSSC